MTAAGETAEVARDQEPVLVERLSRLGRVQIPPADGLPRSRTSPSTIRISIPSGGRPSVVARFSAESSGDPIVIIGTSVMPYPWVSCTSISRTTAW